MADVRESVRHLFSLGRFDDVSVEATMAGAGVALEYRLTPLHVVSSVDFEGQTGAPGVDVGALRRAVRDRYGNTPSLGRIQEMASVVGDLLLESGYRSASVEPRAVLDPGSSRARLIFTIDPGARTTIGAIDVAGTTSRDAVLRVLRISTGSPYEPQVLAARIQDYVERQRDRGYYEAQITPAVSFDETGRVANLMLTVADGPHVRVVFAGDPLPANRRGELVPVESEGSADEDLLEDSTNRIEEYLRGLGYRDAKAPHTRAESNEELVITFTVARGPQYRVTSVRIMGNTSFAVDDFRAALRTAEGDPFSQATVDTDARTIERFYQARGFARVRTQADAAMMPAAANGGDVGVAVTFTVIEGIRTVVGTVRIVGNADVSDATLRRDLTLQSGSPYFDTALRVDQDTLLLTYANLGYRNATVEADAGFSEDRAQADPTFTVREGARVLVEDILISGNVRTSSEIILRELLLKRGDPLSLAAEQESQRRLAALQLFRRAPQITELRHGDESRRDLLITVEEVAPTTLGEGGGVEGRLRVVPASENGPAVQKFEIAPRAFIDFGRRNLFGKNRTLNLFASGSLHPSDTSSASTVGAGLPEYRLLATFHEPRIGGTLLDGVLTGTIEQQIRSSFNFAQRGVTAQISKRVARAVSLSAAYQLQATHVLDNNVPEDQQPLFDRVFANVRLSSFGVTGAYDTRDDPVDPTVGEYFSAFGQVAARSIGSEVGFIKTFFEGKFVRTVPHSRGTVFVGNARLGLASGFPREVGVDDNGQPITSRDLPEPERFFAGGDTTVRGFALDTLGTPETISPEGFPIGGNAETIFNAELRAPIRGGFGVVGFVDTGNVFAHAVDVDLTELRTAVGGGIRYKSPIGPLRVDLGFKVNRQPGEGLTAWFISFGQAF